MLSTKSRTIPSLTGLRFIAALMVFFSHFQTPGLYQPLSLTQQSGYVGVTFFFVLSGFIIAINYLEKFEKNPIQNTYSYLLARFAKIYPLYLFFHIVCLGKPGSSIRHYSVLTRHTRMGSQLRDSLRPCQPVLVDKRGIFSLSYIPTYHSGT